MHFAKEQSGAAAMLSEAAALMLAVATAFMLHVILPLTKRSWTAWHRSFQCIICYYFDPNHTIAAVWEASHAKPLTLSGTVAAALSLDAV